LSRQCAKCGIKIPRWGWSEGGRKINLQRRRYCLRCSPLGQHNTRRIEQSARNEEKGLICRQCSKALSAAQLKGRLCWNCYYAARSHRRLDAIYALVGEACWNCGYTRGKRGRRVLDFHHVSQTQKLFGLDARNLINLSWDRVIAEIRKCVLLCANCHRECHAGLVDNVTIVRIFRERWSDISIPATTDTSHPPPPAASA
jgi:hypothetical protein